MIWRKRSALAGFPLVTAGFYSKDWILWEAWSTSTGGPWLWAAGYSGALLTAVCIFHVVFIAFFGEAKAQVSKRPGNAMLSPLVILAVLSVVSGFVELPRTLGNIPLFSQFTQTALPGRSAVHVRAGTELVMQLLAMATSLIGISFAYLFSYAARSLSHA
ncbi:MAG: hypothetical protein HYZ72_19405 [Deltaproteobacteria bacterium]|nr:hypothetical protein [Deltaproteobacteria bacterium]